MKLFIIMLGAALGGTAALYAWRSPATTPAHSALASPHSEDAAPLHEILDQVEAGQLHEALAALDALAARAGSRSLPSMVQLRKVIGERQRFGEQLAGEAARDLDERDLSGAQRRFALAVELDEGVSRLPVAARLAEQAAQFEAHVARASSCATERKFRCLREAIDSAREFDRAAAAAQFWSFYESDWSAGSAPIPAGPANPRDDERTLK